MRPGTERATWLAKSLGYVSLFGSLGTLLCCALPALLVLAGLGTTVAALLSSMPGLVTLSQHKGWVFVVAGAFIASNGLYAAIAARRTVDASGACPPDRLACVDARRFSGLMLWTSIGVYATGLFVAYGLGPILDALA